MSLLLQLLEGDHVVLKTKEYVLSCLVNLLKDAKVQATVSKDKKVLVVVFSFSGAFNSHPFFRCSSLFLLLSFCSAGCARSR